MSKVFCIFFKILRSIIQQGTLFELHEAVGIEHRTIASCKVRFHELLDRPQGKLRGSATLVGEDFEELELYLHLYLPRWVGQVQAKKCCYLLGIYATCLFFFCLPLPSFTAENRAGKLRILFL